MKFLNLELKDLELTNFNNLGNQKDVIVQKKE